MARITLSMPLIVVILAATAIPAELRSISHAGFEISARALDITLNILGYVPLGVVLSARWPAPAVILTAASVSAVAETSQLFAANRYPSPFDFLFNVAGAGFGLLLASLWSINLAEVPLGRRPAIAAAVGVAVLAGLLGFPGLHGTIQGWDPRLKLVLGDEPTLDRPWDGHIIEAAVLPRALDQREITDIANRQTLSDLPVAPVFGPVRDMDLREKPGKSFLSNKETVEMHQAILSEGTFTILVIFRTENLDQGGPARIITYSDGPYFRNFTLGQEKRSLIFRVRTPASGPNGMEPELQTPPVLTSASTAIVAATYDGHISRVFVNGKLAERLNLAAAGKPIASLADIHLPAVAVTLGILAAVAVLGFWRPETHLRCTVVAALAGLGSGILILMVGGGAAVPIYEPWLPALGFAGGLVTAASVKLGRLRTKRWREGPGTWATL